MPFSWGPPSLIWHRFIPTWEARPGPCPSEAKGYGWAQPADLVEQCLRAPQRLRHGHLWRSLWGGVTPGQQGWRGGSGHVCGRMLRAESTCL